MMEYIWCPKEALSSSRCNCRISAHGGVQQFGWQNPIGIPFYTGIVEFRRRITTWSDLTQSPLFQTKIFIGSDDVLAMGSVRRAGGQAEHPVRLDFPFLGPSKISCKYDGRLIFTREYYICLETLDIRQTEISNLPPEIGALQKLKSLDARQTLISCLPREIGKLQNLETLDVRQTQVEELPKEIVQLPKLAHLYFGQISSLRRVKLPMGSDQLKSVKVFGTVDSREWSENTMEEINGLTGVRKLEVVLHDQLADKDQNDKLLSSIVNCENLEFLIIHGDYNPSDELPVSPFCPLLERLKVAGRFVKVPRWLAQLTTLKQLYVRVCKLDRDDLKILGGLPGLRNLALALVGIPRKKEVAIPIRLHSSTCTDLPPREETCPAVFTSLEIFSFDCRVPWITFEKGAMATLKHLHLKFHAFPVGKFISGITNLHSLEKIILQYPSEYASSGGVTKVVAAMREEASSHRNLIDLQVNGYHEDFPPNTRVDGMITGTGIEEDSNHGNLIKTSVNGDPEVVTRVDESITRTETEEASNHGDQISVDGDCEVLLSNTRADETITGVEIKECY